jgi:hypothetical protein
MSQIRSDILYQRQIKEINQSDHQMKRLHIATPIASDDFDDSDDQIEPINEEDEEELIIVSDDDDEKDGTNAKNIDDKGDEGEPNTEENEDQWSAVISRWIEEANHENQVENDNDEIFLNGNLIDDFSVGTRNIHPADDPNAKWKIETLFLNSLESPTYAELFQISR